MVYRVLCSTLPAIDRAEHNIRIELDSTYKKRIDKHCTILVVVSIFIQIRNRTNYNNLPTSENKKNDVCSRFWHDAPI